LQALEAFLPAGAWAVLTTLPEGRRLAEALVAHHWVPGAALGSTGLRARAAAGVDAMAADRSKLELQYERAM